MNILVVEDDELNQRMMSMILTSQGHVIGFASNGMDALEEIKSRKYDLVFMDLIMPVMDGFETCRRIREWEAGNGHIPVVALTAYALPGQSKKCHEAGMDDCITKPFEMRRINEVIESCAGKFRAPVAKKTFASIDMSKGETLLLDVERALPLFGNDINLYRNLLVEFVQSFPEKLVQMQDDLDSGNLGELSIRAHNLKGVSANIGAMRLSVLASKLDQQSSKGQSNPARKTLEEMSALMDSLHTKAAEMFEQKDESLIAA